MKYHEPVLVKDVIEGLRVAKGKRFIDATFGGGGHSKAIIEAGGEVLAIDTDKDAIEESKNIQDAHFQIVQGNFADVEALAQKKGFFPIDGILFDLGVSSHQLDEASRGFSYRMPEAALDLRLNQQEGESAAAFIDHATEETLIHIFRAFGEEESSGRIAHALVRARAISPIRTTGDLYSVIEKAVGEKRAAEVSSRIFQSIRIAINDELEHLKQALHGSLSLVKVGGRIAVISFHSLEDRIVKQFLQKNTWKVITKKPIVATFEEIGRNKRSRSAKLRIAERL